MKYARCSSRPQVNRRTSFCVLVHCTGAPQAIRQTSSYVRVPRAGRRQRQRQRARVTQQAPRVAVRIPRGKAEWRAGVVPRACSYSPSGEHQRKAGDIKGNEDGVPVEYQRSAACRFTSLKGIAGERRGASWRLCHMPVRNPGGKGGEGVLRPGIVPRAGSHISRGKQGRGRRV